MKSTATAIDSLHCLDEWMLRHCRWSVLEDSSDEKLWGDWVKEVSVEYSGTSQILSPYPLPQNSRQSFFIVACLHNNAQLLKAGYNDHILVNQ
jgi:hypothetical protein